MSKPIIPVLDRNIDDSYSSHESILMYLTRHFLYSPGSTSSLDEPNMLSFRKLEATYHDNISKMISVMQNSFQKVLNKYFNTLYTVTFSTFSTKQAGYGIKISITDSATGVIVIPAANFLVTDTSISIIDNNLTDI